MFHQYRDGPTDLPSYGRLDSRPDRDVGVVLRILSGCWAV
jgi:hypothetical protein